MSSSNSTTGNTTSSTNSTSTSSTSSSSSSSSSVGAGIAIALTVVVVTAIVVGLLVLRRRRRRRRRNRSDGLQPHHISSSSNPSLNVEDNYNMPGAGQVPMLNLRSGTSEELGGTTDDDFRDSSQFGPRNYSYRELSIATKNFSQSELLGAGGFGSVYRGTLPDHEDGTYVAVKCIADNSKQGAKEYKAEVTIISDLRHRNLVRLRGWCHDRGKFMLVYDYMPNGSLDSLLFDDSLCSKLSWERRYTIASGLGSALLYLHEECEKVIIHRDIKSSNLLLDESFVAKLGDFGLSRQVIQGITSHTTVMAGTRGYMAPECFFGIGKATRETDVFAFGAVLLELVCGKRVIDGSLIEHECMLVDWVWHLHGQGRVMEAVDKRLEGRYEKEEARRMLLVGLVCSNPDPKARPKARRALEALMGSVPLPSVPPSKPALLFGPPLPMSVSEILDDSSTSAATSTTTTTSTSSSNINLSKLQH